MRQEKGATTLSLTTLGVTDLIATLSINDSTKGVYYNAYFRYAECHLFIVTASSKCHYAERSSSEYHHYADLIVMFSMVMLIGTFLLLFCVLLY
jgi:hypothetical protein